MARKGGKRGGSSAARSAAAKKGWETRRRGGAGKGTSKSTTPSQPKATPKTTTARGRARTRATEARRALNSGGGNRAARSLLTAQRATAYYKATGTGTRRSQVGGGSKPAKTTVKGSSRKAKAGERPAVKPTASGRNSPPKRKLSADLPIPKRKPSTGTALAHKLGRVYIRAKAVEARNGRTIPWSARRDKSYATSQRALAFLNKVGTHEHSTFNRRPVMSTTKRRGAKAVAALGRAMKRKGVVVTMAG